MCIVHYTIDFIERMLRTHIYYITYLLRNDYYVFAFFGNITLQCLINGGGLNKWEGLM